MSKHKRNFILVILIVVFLSVLHVTYVFQYVRKEIRGYQARITDMNIQTLTERLHNDTDQLGVLAAFLGRQKKGFWHTDEAQKLIEDFQNHSNFTKIGVANTNGTMYLTKGSLPVNVSEQNCFKFAMEGKISMESILKNIDGQDIRQLNIGIPIYREGEANGVLIGSYAVNDLNRLLPTGLSHRKVYSFIVRNDGRIIINGAGIEGYTNLDDIWSSKEVEISPEDHQTISESVSDNKKGTISYYNNGEKHYLISVPVIFSDIYARVGAARWNLLVDIPAHYIVKKASHLLIENMTYAVLLLALFAALSIRFYQEKNKEFRLMEASSRTDAVTGGYNRRALEQEFEKALMEHPEFSVYLIDLDNFKQINDRLGHLTGDKVLIRFSHILNQVSRENAGFSGRLGGDEFLLCLPVAEESLAKQVAEGIVAQFLSSFPEYSERYHLGVTIGIAFLPRHGTDLYSLLEHADDALYSGKRKGKKCVTVAK